MNAARITVDRVAQVAKTIAALSTRSVLVGVPDSAKNTRKDDAPLNNATIGYLMENGSPAANIPARPHLVPGVKDSAPEYLPELRAAAASALAASPGDVDVHLQSAGIIATNAVRLKISEGMPPPLADATLRARDARRKRGSKGARAELASRAAGNAPSIGGEGTTPLIDTGQYRNSITYVVR